MTKNNIFIINGQKTCGKDYFIKELSKSLGLKIGKCPSYSTVDVIKEMYKIIGYKEDDPEVKERFRAVLSDAKDSIDRNLNDWTTKNCIDRAINANKNLKNGLGVDVPLPIFIHNREPEKIKLMVSRFKELGLDVRTLKINAEWQSDTPQNVTCHADLHVNEFDYDIVFNNTKDISKFERELFDFKTKHIK